MWQAEPLQQGGEPRVGAEWIEHRQACEIEIRLALLFGAREDLERRVYLSQRAEQPRLGNDSRRSGWAGSQFVEECAGSLRLAIACQRPPEDADEDPAAVRQRDGALRQRDPVCHFPERYLRHRLAIQGRDVLLLK